MELTVREMVVSGQKAFFIAAVKALAVEGKAVAGGARQAARDGVRELDFAARAFGRARQLIHDAGHQDIAPDHRPVTGRFFTRRFFYQSSERNGEYFYGGSFHVFYSVFYVQ